MHNVLDPVGPFASATLQLFRTYFGATLIVYVLVVAALVFGIARARARAAILGTAPDVDPDARRERRLGAVVGTCVGLTTAILLTLLVADFATGRRIEALVRPNALALTVTGHQWWWEISYDDSLPSRRLHTANEIHIPTGRPVRITLRSSDVIHSFWVPNLGGKRDLIPGKENEVWIQADRPGTYEGQCAEFCGLQHAHMRLTVIAEPADSFEAWRTAQLAPAPAPADTLLARGREVFLATTCVMCHSVGGTPARAGAGPDLTHVGARRTIGAGSLTMTREHLAQWIGNPGSVKPGAGMPPHPMPDADLAALSAWLASLR